MRRRPLDEARALPIVFVWYASGYKRAFYVKPETVLSFAQKRATTASAISMKPPGTENAPTWTWRDDE